jgi:hypothetical protein
LIERAWKRARTFINTNRGRIEALAEAPAKSVRVPAMRLPHGSRARIRLSDDRLGGNVDFTVYWWDADTMGPSIGAFPAAMGAPTYLNNAKRYSAGTWPTKKLEFFSEEGTTLQLPADAPPTPVPCPGCPSETGAGGSSTG